MNGLNVEMWTILLNSAVSHLKTLTRNVNSTFSFTSPKLGQRTHGMTRKHDYICLLQLGVSDHNGVNMLLVLTNVRKEILFFSFLINILVTKYQLRRSLSSFQRCAWPRGKMLGGTGQINAMWYVRGSRHDYDRYLIPYDIE